MTATPFQHKFTPENIIMSELNGYIQCLSTLYKYLEEVTERNPDKRFIDAIDLLDKIQATSADLQPLFGAAINNFVKDQEVKHYAEKN